MWPPIAHRSTATTVDRADDRAGWLIEDDSTPRHRHPGVTADGYSAGTLDRWIAVRERGIPSRHEGEELLLHRDPVAAAHDLADLLGGRALAQVWLAEAARAIVSPR